MDTSTTIYQIVSTPGTDAVDANDNSTYIGPSFRALGVPVDTATLTSLTISIAGFDGSGNGEIHVYLAAEVSENVFKRVATAVFVGGITQAGDFDVPIAAFGLTDDEIQADWHVCTYTPSLSTAGVSRGMVNSAGWRCDNKTLPVTPTACNAMTAAPKFTAVVSYSSSARDANLVDMLKVAYEHEGIGVGNYYQRPALKPLLITYFFDTDYGSLIKGWGSTWYDAITGDALPWWAPGATADFDFANDRYMLDGAGVSRATAIATDISGRLSTDGLAFTGVLGEQVQVADGASASIFANAANAFELLVQQADDATVQALIDATAATAPTSNRYFLFRRSGNDGTAYLRDLLDLNIYAGSNVSAQQLRQGQTSVFAADPIWIRGSFGVDAIALQDHSGGIATTDPEGVLPTGLARIYYGGAYDGSAFPLKGSITRAIHWNKARDFAADTIRNGQILTLSDVDFRAECNSTPYAMRFADGLTSSPLIFETHAGDHRPGETDRSRTEIGMIHEVDHEQVYWAAWAFKPVELTWAGSYFIVSQLHPDSTYGVAPMLRIDWTNAPGAFAISGNYVAADAPGNPPQPTEVFDVAFDLPMDEWSWMVLKLKSSTTDGLVSLWANGQQVLDYTGPFGFLQLGHAGYLKFGNYQFPLATDTSITKIANVRGLTTEDLSHLIDAPEPIVGEKEWG